jgi:hypothetical protein
MVIKETILHSGWSYGNGDDQYDNESLGSTRTVVKKKKLVENPTSNKKNERCAVDKTTNIPMNKDGQQSKQISANLNLRQATT